LEIRNSESKRKYCFELYLSYSSTTIKAMKREKGQIQKGHHNNYFIAADSREEMESWMKAISENIFQGTSKQFDALRRNRIQRNNQASLPSDGSSSSSSSSSITLSPSSSSSSSSSSSPLGETTDITVMQTKFGVTFVDLRNYAQMASLVYQDAAKIRAVHSTATVESPIKSFNWYSVINSSSQTQIIVIGGIKWTKSAQLLADLSNRSKQSLPDQYGTLAVAKQIYKNVNKTLQRTFKTIIIGHSVGGCIAAHLASQLRKKNFMIKIVVTFGQPKDITDRLLSLYDRLPVIRVVNEKDPIVSLFSNFSHIGSKLILLRDIHYCFVEDPMIEADTGTPIIDDDSLQLNSIEAYERLITPKLTRSIPVRLQMLSHFRD